jgi:very-short-patch-repair endonuclease
MRDNLRRTSPELTQRAKGMRKEKTPAEALLWEHLRANRFSGTKWREQYPIGGYILDFYCAEARLAVELDGLQHDLEETRTYDQIRSELLAGRVRIIRFRNADVLTDTDRVLERIAAAL